MSYATVVYADYVNNDYRIRVPGVDSDIIFKAQRISHKTAKVDEVVEVVDINNLPPNKAVYIDGKIRIRGSLDESPKERWFPVEEMKAKGYDANILKAFMYSAKENPRWQTECPIYRKGTVTIIHDKTYMTVLAQLSGELIDLKCPTEYPP